jgi:hypothetical protein
LQNAQKRCAQKAGGNLSHGETNFREKSLTKSQPTPKNPRRTLARKKLIVEHVHTERRRERFLQRLKAAVQRSARHAAESALFVGFAGLVVLIPVLLLFGAVGVLFSGSTDVENAPVSDEVKSYSGLIQLYATEHGIPEYTELIMAVMMQESGGLGNDPMQASESGFNTQYPKTPGGITDPAYSVSVGIQALADCLTRAGAESPQDLDRISLALQGYNFGAGYISWAMSNYGGYSQENAIEFSLTMAQQQGWSSYGDPYYVSHVLRYYGSCSPY